MGDRILKGEFEDLTPDTYVIDLDEEKEEPEKKRIPSFKEYLEENVTPEKTHEEIAEEYQQQYGSRGDDIKTIYQVLEESRADNGRRTDYTNDKKRIETNGKKKPKKKKEEEKYDDPFADYTDDDFTVEMDRGLEVKSEEKWYQAAWRKFKNLFSRGK
ncbi:MAG: hypothetical protein ACE5J7_03035 [Candidatus Aenigmatarchaeota archaeon]